METNKLRKDEILLPALSLFEGKILCVNEVLLHRDYILNEKASLQLQVEVNVQTLEGEHTAFLCLHCYHLTPSPICPYCHQPVSRKIPVEFPKSLLAECMECKQMFKGEEIITHTLQTGHQRFIG